MNYVRTVLTLLAAMLLVEVAQADETKSLEQLEYEYRVRLFAPTPVSPAIREALRISEENRMQRELLELDAASRNAGIVSVDTEDHTEPETQTKEQSDD